jgi:hypothetical protein
MGLAKLAMLLPKICGRVIEKDALEAEARA